MKLGELLEQRKERLLRERVKLDNEIAKLTLTLTLLPSRWSESDVCPALLRTLNNAARGVEFSSRYSSYDQGPTDP